MRNILCCDMPTLLKKGRNKERNQGKNVGIQEGDILRSKGMMKSLQCNGRFSAKKGANCNAK